MGEEFVLLDPCPDSVWAQLPDGPVALDEELGEVWQYMGSAHTDGTYRHEFRHRSHPGYGGARVYAHVLDDDTGPRLHRLRVNGQDLCLSDEVAFE